MYVKEPNKKIKELQNLYSWSEFYSRNEKWNDYEKTQNQIEKLESLIKSKNEKK